VKTWKPSLSAFQAFFGWDLELFEVISFLPTQGQSPLPAIEPLTVQPLDQIPILVT